MVENREVKSDVFSMLMQEKKYALQVYNAVNETDYKDSEQIEINTLKKGISLSIRNDASIILDMNLNIYEHQSTYSPNMPLRSLIYLVDILKPLLAEQDLFGRKRISIPTPRFVVFYNGIEKRPAIEKLRLSDAFENKMEQAELELICVVYNINPDMNEEMLSRCQVLKEYTEFIERIRKLEKEGIAHPIENSIKWCIENNILKEFLIEHGEEVLKIMIIDMTFERREELIRRDERAEGRLEGKIEGKIEGRTEAMRELLILQVSENEITVESAAKRLGITVEEFQKLMSEN